MRTVYRCPFEDTEACPRIVKFADDEVYIRDGCTIGPLARRTGDCVQTICRLVIDPEIVRGPEDLADSLDDFMVLGPGTREVVKNGED